VNKRQQRQRVIFWASEMQGAPERANNANKNRSGRPFETKRGKEANVRALSRPEVSTMQINLGLYPRSEEHK
jgi:hypothetical protein